MGLDTVKKKQEWASISFIGEASIDRYRKQHYSFTNSGKITTVNKIKNPGLKEMPQMALA